MKLKDRLAEDLKNNLDYHLTTYKNSTGWLGRAWLTLNGIELVNFSNPDTWKYFKSYSNELCETGYISHAAVKDEDRSNNAGMERGEFSKYNFSGSAFEFLTELNIEQSQKSTNPIHRMLAMLDKRTGKRRIFELREKETHPLVLKMIELRIGK
ncbi:hypothetical protein E1171_03780 [Cytophagales bacterium RKSG123]|nr:hypothetical protein [Xanthovirga aplysinae]MTI29922.1 hypothetical protein [Xanthovirga aplysinae]